MKNLLLVISILLFCNLNYGQIAIIKDVDGFTNVRQLPKIDSEVIYKLKDSEVFSFRETESDWITVYISKNKYQLACGEDDTFIGYIHKSRLSPIVDLPEYSGSEFSFEYKLEKFNIENKNSDFDGKWLSKINGRRIYGTDGNIPKTEVVGIETGVNGKTIEISEMFYQDIFECSNEFIINKNQDDYIVHQWNSDGAGGYLIVWVIGSDKLKQRLIFIP